MGEEKQTLEWFFRGVGMMIERLLVSFICIAPRERILWGFHNYIVAKKPDISAPKTCNILSGKAGEAPDTTRRS